MRRSIATYVMVTEPLGARMPDICGGHGVAPTTFTGEVLAPAIAEGDRRWPQFADYPLVSALKPAGFAAAQLSCWWLQAKDGFNARSEG